MVNNFLVIEGCEVFGELLRYSEEQILDHHLINYSRE